MMPQTGLVRNGHGIVIFPLMASLHPLARATRALSTAVSSLPFSDPVAHVYNPLDYAWPVHAEYLRRFGYGDGRDRRPRHLLLGMNPGPFGMAQTGVPFGAVGMVRDWLGLDRRDGERLVVGAPEETHPKRPVLGFGTTREEVSGARLWGWARDTFSGPEAFFDRFFVVNYCPLLFLHATGRNLTPDKIARAEREPLLEICDHGLRTMTEHLEVESIIGVGTFAEKAAKRVFGDALPVRRILHPSPASPVANRGWAEAATRQFAELGIELPG